MNSGRFTRRAFLAVAWVMVSFAGSPHDDAVAAPMAISNLDDCWDDRFGNGMNAVITSLVLDGGNLYVGGGFTGAGSVNANYVARWNGTSWSALGTGLPQAVNALAVDGSGNLYAGGFFGIRRWDGTIWSALGTGVNNWVYALAVDGSGNLYAGGDFTTAGGVSAIRVAKWNGTSWSALGTGLGNRVYALTVDGSGNLYAGGDFAIAGGSQIAKWNGTSWSAVGTGMNGTVRALLVDANDNLYAGGLFNSAGGTSANRIAKWNGSSWSALGVGMNAQVNALAVDGSGSLYAGGSFTFAGGASANYVARWNGTSWSTLGSGTNNTVSALAVDAGANLYAGGSFTTAGPVPSNYFAEWHRLARYRDNDGDGYGDPTVSMVLDCDAGVPPGYVADKSDCDDTDPAVHPGAPDLTCNGVDNDCDGLVDDGVSGCACVENAPGLIGWWRGNGNADDAAAGNHGMARNGAGYAAGRVGQAFSLDGVDDYVANLGDAYSYAFIENTGVFTINAWIKLNNPNLIGQQTITSNTGTTIENGHFFIFDNNTGDRRLRIGLMRGINGSPVIDEFSPANVIADNAWHHVAAVGNGTTITLYVDGVRYPGAATMSTKPTGPAPRAVDLGIMPNNAGPFGGLIDELEIHDRGLSAAEIRAIYQAGASGMCGPGCAQGVAGLVGWWPGSGDTGDRSAFHNHGAVNGAVTYVDGIVGKAFALNGGGTPGLVQIPDTPSLEMTSQLTLATWVRPDDAALNNSARIISKGLAYELLFHTNNNLQPRGGISNDGINYDLLVSPTSLSVGSWSHVAMTFNTGTWKLYIDGIETASTVSAMTSIYSAGTSNLCLGSYPTMSAFLAGAIDEPMVFNRALSPAEITALYQGGASGLCGLGLVVNVEEPTRPEGSLAFSAPWPNPSSRLIQMRLQLPAEALVRAEVFDVAGRRVALVMDERRLPAGEHRLIWDGRDPSGRRVGAGVYQIRVRANDELAVRRVVMIR